MNTGKFVISLDFELNWGVRDCRSLDEYGANIKGVHEVIPRLLKTFEAYKVCGTFCTVGFLFFKTKAELLSHVPKKIPAYENKKLSPYSGHFETVGEDYKQDLFHFAPDLIELIKNSTGQEIGSHTFSHYYCLERGQTGEDFTADLEAAKETAAKKGLEFTSLVFPRNQFNDEYLEACKQYGIICYRGNEHSWIYTASNGSRQNFFRRAFRFADAYINISGYNCFSDEYLKSKRPVDIPSGRFLRPYSPRLRWLDKLRLRRIKNAMTYAAENNQTYHLWWHPHNFGIFRDENFNFLEKILAHYKALNKEYNFTGITMTDLAKKMIDAE